VTEILRTVADLRARVARWRAEGAVVGVVPTMGALHEGHLSLVRAAQADCGRVIVTIFVNPKQFDRPEDLLRYPRTEESDAALLRPLGVDVVFAPAPAEVYPAGFVSTVSVAGPALQLEGRHRPGHFDGVATVVTKLFGMTGATRAYFGEKDWQQLQVVRRLAADLNLDIEVIGCPTDRDPDGLARSSRNVRLSASARAAAAALPRAMQRAARALREGVPAEAALDTAETALLDAGFAPVDYLALCDGATLEPLAAARPGARLLAAAWIDGVRLIDNIAL
jgi:pantoate--beta-alanine ligase